MKNDVSYIIYWLLIAVLCVKLVLFAAWSHCSGAIYDRRHRIPCIIVFALIAALLYTFSIVVYTRGLMHGEVEQYIAFMNGVLWNYSMLPLLVILLVSDIYLIRWAYIALRIYIHHRRQGEPWIKRH